MSTSTVENFFVVADMYPTIVRIIRMFLTQCNRRNRQRGKRIDEYSRKWTFLYDLTRGGRYVIVNCNNSDFGLHVIAFKAGRKATRGWFIKRLINTSIESFLLAAERSVSLVDDTETQKLQKPSKLSKLVRFSISSNNRTTLRFYDIQFQRILFISVKFSKFIFERST